MPVIPFSEWRPDVSDYQGQYSKNISGVVPRGDGYGPMPSLAALSSALPAACRGLFFARKNDGSVLVFAGTSQRLYTLNNTTFAWTPVTKLSAVTSISNADPAVITYTAHGLTANMPVQFTTTGSLPTGLSTGTVYYVISTGLTADEFSVSTSVGGAAVATSSAGSGTHSVTGVYSALSSNAHWQFEQFNNYVIAVQQNVVPQVFDLTSSTGFADLGGSPPQASYISIVNRFVVLSGLLAPNVYRVQWSGLNATTTWTSGVTQSDYQDLPDGGIVRGVAGGEFGVIFQDQSIRRMIYAPGAPYVFGIDRVSKDDGLYAPYSLIRAGDRIFFLSAQGFKSLVPGGLPTPIGKERFDRTFFDDVDTNSLHLVIGAADPSKTRVYWAYKSGGGATGQFDKILVYDWVLDRATTVSLSGEYLATLARPGLTLEGVDTAFGSDIDTISLGSLDDISAGANPGLAAADTSHQVALFSGSNIEATMETPEQGGDGTRLFVRGFRPVSDASSIYGSVSSRETAYATPSTSNETSLNDLGEIEQRVSARYTRSKIRIPAAATWTFATGVEPNITIEGAR